MKFKKILDWVAEKDTSIRIDDEKEIKFELKRRLTKKEYKILLYAFENSEISDEMLAKLSLDQERYKELLRSSKKKVTIYISDTHKKEQII
jgi:hypothetical protein